MQCSYVAIVHLMQFFFSSVEPFKKYSKRTVFWKKKKLIKAKCGLVGMKGYLEIYNRVTYFLWYFLNATSLTPNFWGVFGR